MKGAKVLFAQPRPPRAIGRRPEIARQAADEAFTAIVDLDEFLPTLIAAFRFSAFCRHEMDCSRKTGRGNVGYGLPWPPRRLMRRELSRSWTLAR